MSKGLFIRSRLQALAAKADVKVIAPLALLDYANPADDWLAAKKVPRAVQDQSIEVLYTRWLYPPHAGVLNGLLLFLQTLWPARTLRKRFSFQLIDAHFVHPEGIAASLLSAVLGCPLMITMRGNELTHVNHFFRRLAMGWAIRRASHIVTMSDELRELAIALGAQPSRVTTIPNGVDNQLFFLRDRAQCRGPLGISDSTRVILTVGDLAPAKGHSLIIQSLARLRLENPTVQFVIAGGTGRSGRYEGILRREIDCANLKDHVRFLGDIPQAKLAEWMSAADVLCMASFREGSPNVVIESLACGTPVVATDVGCVRSLIPSGDYGVVCQTGNQQQIEQALRQTLNQEWDREQIAAWGQSRSWAGVAAETLREIEVIVRQDTARRKIRAIINADDLGISAEVNAAIFNQIAAGHVTSATIIANARYAKQAAGATRHLRECSFGVHLNVTEFEPLIGGAEGKLLLNDQGLLCRAILKRRFGPALLRAIYLEYCAQVESILSMGVPISHLDSHHHAHTVAALFPVLKAVQVRYGIRRVRISKNVYTPVQRPGRSLLIKKHAFNTALRRLFTTHTTEAFTDMISFHEVSRCGLLSHRTIELMVHPGSLGSETETQLVESDFQDLDLSVERLNYNQLHT